MNAKICSFCGTSLASLQSGGMTLVKPKKTLQKLQQNQNEIPEESELVPIIPHSQQSTNTTQSQMKSTNEDEILNVSPQKPDSKKLIYIPNYFNSTPKSSTPPLPSIPPPNDGKQLIIPRPSLTITNTKPQDISQPQSQNQLKQNIQTKPQTQKQSQVQTQVTQQVQSNIKANVKNQSQEIKTLNKQMPNQIITSKSASQINKQSINIQNAKSKSQQELKTSKESNSKTEPENSTQVLNKNIVEIIQSEMTNAINIMKEEFITKSTTPTPKIINQDQKLKNREERIPQSISEILSNLENISLDIEASAIVDYKGRILGAALSRRISDGLLSTIASTLGIIGNDIIHSLNAGEMDYASLIGTQGTLFLTPIMKNVFLILITGPNIKAGIVNIARIKVKKQLDLYLARKNLQKIPL